MKKTTKTVKAYISQFPPNVQGKLMQIRQCFLSCAPKATESISYAMPAYKLQGVIGYFGAFTNHVSLFIPPPVLAEQKKLLKGYQTTKSAVHFDLDRPLPLTLIKQLIRARKAYNKKQV